MKQLKDEIEIATVKGENTSVLLTNKRIVAVMGSENSGETKFIPLDNLDSIAFTSNQYLILLVLGIVIGAYGLILNSNHNSDAYLYIVIGVLLLAGWWFTRKVGAFIYSLSGNNVIFIGASASNRTAIIDFLDKVQETFDKNKSNI